MAKILASLSGIVARGKKDQIILNCPLIDHKSPLAYLLRDIHNHLGYEGFQVLLFCM